MSAPTSLRIKPIARPEPVVRMPLSVKQSSAVLLDQYRAHYQASYGHPVERSTLVEQMLLTLMAEDKGFQRALASGSLANVQTSSSDA